MYEKLQLGFSPLTERIYLGKVGTNPEEWSGEKKDITSNFIAVMLQKFEPNTVSDLKVDGVVKYKITVENINSIKTVDSNNIKIEYDGKYPNRCSGTLVAWINGTRYDFPDHCLSSGGQAWTTSDYDGTTQGDWSVSKWPDDFPEKYKEATLKAINDQTDHGCCGGCI